MTVRERSEFARNFLEKHCFPVLDSKGIEYGQGEATANSNFQRTGDAAGVDKLTVALVYMAKHWDAFCNFIKSRKVHSEPIQGRIADLINYLLIVASIIDEEERAVKAEVYRKQEVLVNGPSFKNRYNTLVAEEAAREDKKLLSGKAIQAMADGAESPVNKTGFGDDLKERLFRPRITGVVRVDPCPGCELCWGDRNLEGVLNKEVGVLMIGKGFRVEAPGKGAPDDTTVAQAHEVLVELGKVAKKYPGATVTMRRGTTTWESGPSR